MTAIALIALAGLIVPAVAAAATEVGDRIHSNRLHREFARTFAGAREE
jgi:hypothetical protein